MRFTPFGSDPTLGILTNCFGDANALYSRQVFRAARRFYRRLRHHARRLGVFLPRLVGGCKAGLRARAIILVSGRPEWHVSRRVHPAALRRQYTTPYPAVSRKAAVLSGQTGSAGPGLSTELPLVTVGEQTRYRAAPPALRDRQTPLPYARVAVITRTKDRPLLLRRAIRSVLDQTFKEWLLVIVNDGGSPDSVDLVVDAMADELSGQVVVLHHPVSFGMQTAANAWSQQLRQRFHHYSRRR